MARRTPVSVVKARPAETATPVVMAAAMLIGGLVGLDQNQTAYLAIILAFVPAAVTWIVELARK
jgi:uncharacterized membrane protein (DUF4010 family)